MSRRKPAAPEHPGERKKPLKHADQLGPRIEHITIAIRDINSSNDRSTDRHSDDSGQDRGRRRRTGRSNGSKEKRPITITGNKEKRTGSSEGERRGTRPTSRAGKGEVQAKTTEEKGDGGKRADRKGEYTAREGEERTGGTGDTSV